MKQEVDHQSSKEEIMSSLVDEFSAEQNILHPTIMGDDEFDSLVDVLLTGHEHPPKHLNWKNRRHNDSSAISGEMMTDESGWCHETALACAHPTNTQALDPMDVSPPIASRYEDAFADESFLAGVVSDDRRPAVDLLLSAEMVIDDKEPIMMINEEQITPASDSSQEEEEQGGTAHVIDEGSHPSSPRFAAMPTMAYPPLNLVSPIAKSEDERDPPLSPPSPDQVMSNRVTTRAIDIFCGRGTGSKQNDGNKNFRLFTALNQPHYSIGSIEENHALCESIYESLAPGRFLKPHKGSWIELDRSAAIDKVKQALREGRQKMKEYIEQLGGGDEGANRVVEMMLNNLLPIDDL